jgi:hypothetical protein
MGTLFYAALTTLVLASALGSVMACSSRSAQAALGLTTLLLGGVATSLGVSWLALGWMLCGMAILLWAFGLAAPSAARAPARRWTDSLIVTAVILCLGAGLTAFLLRGYLPMEEVALHTSGAAGREAPVQQAPGLIAIALALMASLLAARLERLGR